MISEEDLHPDPRMSVSYSEDDLKDVKLIKIKPSTELIPDEYENSGGNGDVYIFRGTKQTDASSTSSLLRILKVYGYDIPTENLDFITSKKEVELKLKTISEKDFTNKSSLIIIFLGEIGTEDDFVLEGDSEYTISTRDVWLPFINCQSLKHKPKIFIFQASEKLKYPEAQSGYDSYKQTYWNIPSEADMLIVYKKVYGNEEARLKFIGALCENFEKFGRRDDIISMVTHINLTDYNRPLIISTLTKKFFIASSTYRDHFLDIDNQLNRVMSTISELQKTIAELEENDVKWKNLQSTSSSRKLDNKNRQIGNNNSKSSMEVVRGSKKHAKRSSEQKSISQATTSVTLTDSATTPGRKFTLKKMEPLKHLHP